ncbi:MAG: D-alanine--D-alanine ligase [Candidatus Falkowbacteria bacterium]
MAKKITIALLCGGKSAEHEVSLQSAYNICQALDDKKYHKLIIAIAKDGSWRLSPNTDFLRHPNNPAKIKLKVSGEPVVLAPGSRGNLVSLRSGKPCGKIDVVFPVLHGPLGEDGTIQGLLKLAEVPFVGADVLGSAVGMDKDGAKRLLAQAGLPIASFVTVRADEPAPSYRALTQKLGPVFFLKPANMGSSVGVHKIAKQAQYLPALENALLYDRKVIIEEYIKGRELECSVLGNDQPQASAVGEVVSTHDFYSYEAKYLDENGARLIIPAELDKKTIKSIQDLAIKTFQTLDCAGLGRVDFFMQTDGRLVINEINTLPGFTKISMYPKLWGASRLGYSQLIDRLITLALERYGQLAKLQSNYQ